MNVARLCESNRGGLPEIDMRVYALYLMTGEHMSPCTPADTARGGGYR